MHVDKVHDPQHKPDAQLFPKSRCERADQSLCHADTDLLPLHLASKFQVEATCSVWMTTVSITSRSQKNKRGCKSWQMAPSDWILDGDLQTKPRGSWLRWYGGVLSVSPLGVLSSVHICITFFKSAGGWRNYLISPVQSLECSWLLFVPKRETLHHPERCSSTQLDTSSRNKI